MGKSCPYSKPMSASPQPKHQFQAAIQWQDHDGRTCVVIGDVCGKGVPAALYMARVLGYFRVAAKVQGEADKIMSFVNELLANEWTEQTFVTAAVCVLDKGGRRMSVSSLK